MGLLILSSALCILIAIAPTVDQSSDGQTRFYIATILLITAALLAVMSRDLIMIYFALQVAAISLYILVGWHYEEATASVVVRSTFIAVQGASFLWLIAFLLLGVANGGNFDYPNLSAASLTSNSLIPGLCAFSLRLS